LSGLTPEELAAYSSSNSSLEVSSPKSKIKGRSAGISYRDRKSLSSNESPEKTSSTDPNVDILSSKPKPSSANQKPPLPVGLAKMRMVVNAVVATNKMQAKTTLNRMQRANGRNSVVATLQADYDQAAQQKQQQQQYHQEETLPTSSASQTASNVQKEETNATTIESSTRSIQEAVMLERKSSRGSSFSSSVKKPTREDSDDDAAPQKSPNRSTSTSPRQQSSEPSRSRSMANGDDDDEKPAIFDPGTMLRQLIVSNDEAQLPTTEASNVVDQPTNNNEATDKPKVSERRPAAVADQRSVSPHHTYSEALETESERKRVEAEALEKERRGLEVEEREETDRRQATAALEKEEERRRIEAEEKEEADALEREEERRRIDAEEKEEAEQNRLKRLRKRAVMEQETFEAQRNHQIEEQKRAERIRVEKAAEKALHAAHKEKAENRKEAELQRMRRACQDEQVRLETLEATRQSELEIIRIAMEEEKTRMETAMRGRLEDFPQTAEPVGVDPDLENEIKKLEEENSLLESTLKDMATAISTVKGEITVSEGVNLEQGDLFETLADFVKRETTKNKKLVATKDKLKEIKSGLIQLIFESQYKNLYRSCMYKCVSGVQASDRYDHDLYKDVMRTVSDVEGELGCEVVDWDIVQNLQDVGRGDVLVTASWEKASQGSMSDISANERPDMDEAQIDKLGEGMEDYAAIISNITVELGETQMATLRENKSMLLSIFKLLDRDRSGGIDMEEFELGVELLNKRLSEASRFKDHKALFRALDADGNGTVDLDEFAQIFNLNEGGM
jgi:Ca2+-binding EF-hand superfamily protein